MAEALEGRLVARRNAPLAFEWTFTDKAGAPFDFAGCTLTMQVRLYGAQPGDPLVDLAAVTTPQTEGLIVGPGSVQVFISEGSLFLMPVGGPGKTVVFAYDLMVAEPGQPAERWRYGDFYLLHGSTERTFALTGGGSILTTGDGALLIAG